MLSDSLFSVRQKLLKEISYYAKWDIEYPKSQESNLILALYHLALAQAAYDFGCKDNHIFNVNEKLKAMKRAKAEFHTAVSAPDTDTDSDSD